MFFNFLITNINFINNESKDIKEQIKQLQNQMKKLDNKEFKDQTKITFKNINNKFEHPFSIYLDFESTLQTCDELEDKPKNAEKNTYS